MPKISRDRSCFNNSIKTIIQERLTSFNKYYSIRSGQNLFQFMTGKHVVSQQPKKGDELSLNADSNNLVI